MADIVQEINAISDVLNSAQKGSYATAGVCALLVYDIGILFARELEFIWKAKWTIGKILYILARYGALAYQVVLLLNTLLDNPSSHLCAVVFRMNVWLSIVNSSLIQALMALRTAAIHGDKRYMKILVFCIWMVQAIVILYTAISTTVEAKEVGAPFSKASCVFYFNTSINTATIVGFATDCVTEVLIWLLASVKIYKLAMGGESRLAWLIFRDTFFILPVNIALSIAGFVTLLATPKEHAVVVLNVNGAIVALSSIASTRAVFNIRAYVSSSVRDGNTHPIASHRQPIPWLKPRPSSSQRRVQPTDDGEWQEMRTLGPETLA